MFRNTLPASSQAHASASSSPPVRPSQASDSDWEVCLPMGRPPTLQQLNALTAVPTSLVSGSRSGKVRRSKGRLVKEGQIISKIFDAFGSRPQPSNGLSLEQSVQIEMEYSTQSFISSSTTPTLYTYAALNTTVNQFAGTAVLLQVFDQYRLDQVEVWLDPITPNSTGAFPLLFSAVDLDDSSTPTSVGQIQDKQGAVTSTGPGGHYHRYKPHMAIAAFSGAFTSYSNACATWIDSNSPNVQHYGLKVGMQSAAATSVGYNLTVRAVLSFRAPANN